MEHFAVGPLACTCTIVADSARAEAIVVDGGDDVAEILARLGTRGVRATHLVHTHAHIDHIGCFADLRDATGGRGLLHAADLPLYAAAAVQASWLGMKTPRLTALDGELRDGDRIDVGSASLEVIHTPGHTPGSVSFALRLAESTVILSGDTLFRGAIGRWDLGGTSRTDIVNSIHERLLPFADDTLVVPGHGPQTTIGTERRENPYLQMLSR